MRTYAAIAAIGVVGLAQARADVVVYDNSDGTFVWTMSYAHADIPGKFLRIDQPPTQHGLVDPNGLAATYWDSMATPHEWRYSFETWNFSDTVRVVEDIDPTVVIGEIGPYHIPFVSTLGVGDVVGPGSNFDTSAPWRVHTGVPDEHVISFPAYIGVSVELLDGTHYGWILVDRGQFNDIKPLAWAYETSPDTPIVVPAPGAAAVLALGVVAVGRRRRRR